MSSRNSRLTQKQLEIAPFIYKTLLDAKEKFKTFSATQLKKFINAQFDQKEKLELEYFEIVNDSEKKINLILNDGVNDSIFSDVTDEKINYYRNNYWLIENVDKPIKAMTGYSKEELFTIINKLEIKDITMKMTKKVKYEKILEKI